MMVVAMVEEEEEEEVGVVVVDHSAIFKICILLKIEERFKDSMKVHHATSRSEEVTSREPVHAGERSSG